MQGTEIADVLQFTVDLLLAFAVDFLAFIVIAGAVALFALYFGRDRIVPLTAALYAAIPLYVAFPYTEFVTTPLVHVALYIVLTLLALIAFSGLSAFIASGSLGLVKLAIISGAIAGMLIAISIHILPVEELYTFSAPTRALFESGEAFFLWLLAPLAAIFVFGRG
ncbi:MAG: hypothetical protein ACE5F4_01010 [Candidatus Paceibacteria bacterium]